VRLSSPQHPPTSNSHDISSPTNQPSPTKQPSSTLSSPSKQPNTYNDILETLKLLEEVPAPLSSDQPSRRTSYLSAENLEKLTSPKAPVVSHSASLTEGKLSNILAYLDEMEKADQDLLSQVSKSRTVVKSATIPKPSSIAQTKDTAE